MPAALCVRGGIRDVGWGGGGVERGGVGERRSWLLLKLCSDVSCCIFVADFRVMTEQLSCYCGYLCQHDCDIKHFFAKCRQIDSVAITL